ncbi:hypothetical protein CP98_02072 [Sphingobium yanoikuyae]|uniref:Uncharacterized protein n=1 Tax=Sphingobium yanoikuyae TaxID=13690 RepID=A0A084EMG9_SPHYA|nr:hypothetical protein [Sphingobium yanoikuyae]KEZ19161.1 hypothetical protein CP98_02072 [Sphingobium yanoikuyae]
MNEEIVVERNFGGRFSDALNRVEELYLRVLRAIVLIVATMLILYALWLGISGAFGVMRSPTSVVEQPATVNADELTSAELPEQSAPRQPTEPGSDPNQMKFYAGFVTKYYDLYRKSFEPFRQQDDKRLSKDEFDDSFIQTDKRLDAIRSGELDFGRDKADLGTLLTIMSEAAQKTQTQERLKKYKSAQRVPVTKQVQRTRTETRRGWDRYSMACPDWYQDPMGCTVTRTVEIPYTETVKSMEFPKGTQSHTQIFRAFQDRYFSLLTERRERVAREAQAERESIIEGNATGWISLKTALSVVGGFLVLMFFFLLIAIERHQRRLSAELSHSGD